MCVIYVRGIGGNDEGMTLLQPYSLSEQSCLKIVLVETTVIPTLTGASELVRQVQHLVDQYFRELNQKF